MDNQSVKSLIFYLHDESLGTGHKVWGRVGRQNLFKWRRFSVGPPLKKG